MDECGAGNMPTALESCLVDFCQAKYAVLNRSYARFYTGRHSVIFVPPSFTLAVDVRTIHLYACLQVGYRLKFSPRY